MLETIYYDGHCGLCHGFVKFVLARDKAANFHFSPLDNLPAAERAGLPDSVVVKTPQGLITKSDAALHVLKQLNQPWPALAHWGGLVPKRFRDLIYDTIARVRYRVFGKRDNVCPLVPKELRSRFQ